MEALKRLARRLPVLRRRADKRKLAHQAEQLRTLRHDNLVLRRSLEYLGTHPYGSLTPGVVGWQERWEASPGGRVLLFAPRDHSGSLLKWARAINDHTDYAARLVALQAHPYGYDTDLVLLPPNLPSPGISELADEADIVHVKDETGFLDGSNGLPEDFLWKLGKPVVFTQYGGYARKHRDDPPTARW